MKVTIFSSNQPRHLNLAKEFSKICDAVFLVSEVNTVFPGQIKDFFKKSEIMQTYFKNVIQSEKNILKTNAEFHKIIEIRKKNVEEKIEQMKNQAIRDIKNSSIEIAIQSVKKIIKNSIDKKKLDKIYVSSIDEAKKILKNKSI